MQATFFLGSCTPRGFSTFASELAEECGAVDYIKGGSGCGKSTFLKTLDRMNDLVPGVRIEGEVQYNGQNIFAPQVDVNELRRQIGMVFQKPNPFPMSIYDITKNGVNGAIVIGRNKEI